jgi:hypothetical protein
MKTRFIRLSLLALVLSLAVGTVDAQAPASRKKTKRTTKKANTSKNSAANTAVVPPPVKDTVKPVQEFIADIKLDTPRKSLRNDASIELNLVKDRTPLAYENIREDDVYGAK